MVDLAIFIIIALAVAAGLYRGFLFSFVRILAFFIAWVIALFMYPMVTQTVREQTTWIKTMLYYTEDTYQISELEIWRMPIDDIPSAELERVMESSKLPAPFDRLLRENISTHAFRLEGHEVLKDYFNYTVVYGIINICSFLAVFAFAHILCLLVVEALDHVFHFPVIRIWDPVGGLACGLLYGFLVMALLLALLPVGLVMVPGDLLTKPLADSTWLPVFERFEWITSAIKGYN